MIYLFGWGALYSLFFIQAISRYRGRFFVFFMLLFFAVVAFIRGNVGTDTANFELMLEGFLDDYIWDGIEPGFVALGWLLAVLTPSVELAVRAISLVFFGLIAWFVVRSDRNERYILMAYILSAFAYQYSMNGLRIGIASAVLLIAVQALRRKSEMSALRIGLLAVLFHYSAAFSLLFIAISRQPWLRASTVFGMFALLLGMGAGVFFVEFYLMDKFEAYQLMQAPGPLSGLSKVVPLAVILTGLMLGSLPRVIKLKLLTLSVSGVLAAWVLTQYSYAGLRVLDLLSFSIPLSILAAYSYFQLLFDRPAKVTLVLAGMISAAGTWRGFLLGYGEGKTPFMPYEIFDFGLF